MDEASLTKHGSVNCKNSYTLVFRGEPSFDRSGDLSQALLPVRHTQSNGLLYKSEHMGGAV